MPSYITKDDDHVYVNMKVEPSRSLTNPVLKKCAVSVNFGDAVIKKPEEYHLIVQRFGIPAENIPIFIYPTLGAVGSYTANDNVFSVTLSAGGQFFQAFTTYISNETYAQTNTIEYYFIYSYIQYIDMVNVAFASAFTSLKATFPGIAATRAPYLVYNPDTKLVSLIYQPSYLGFIDVYMNTPMYEFFDSWDVSYSTFLASNGTYAKLLLKNRLNNSYREPNLNVLIATNSTNTITSAGLFTINMDGAVISAQGIPINTTARYVDANTMTLSVSATATGPVNAIFSNWMYSFDQEYATLYLWSSLQKIVITSGTLPTANEYTPSTVDPGSSNNFQKIITDFSPDIQTGTDSRSVIQYLPTAEYRRIDLKGNVELTTIDLQAYWQTYLGTLHPITLLPYAGSAEFKLCFEKKSKYIVSRN